MSSLSPLAATFEKLSVGLDANSLSVPLRAE